MAQLIGLFNVIIGHEWDIHVILYGIAVTFHAASLMYHVHVAFSVRVNVLFHVHPPLFRLYGASASSLLSDHDIVNITFPLVHQFVKFQDG